VNITIIATLLTVAAFSLLSLTLGAPYLEALLPGGLPLGNVLAAASLCSVAGAAAGLSVRGTAMRTVALAFLAAAVAWLPVSIMLAGNLSLNFSGGRGTAWWAFSLIVAIGVLITLFSALVISLLARFRRSA
jgi:hypothetical protein